MKLRLTAVLISAIGVQVPLWAAPQPASEAPAGFDTPTLVKAPGSMSSSNGILEPSDDHFALDQQIYETQHDATTGLGPVFNGRACAECHQNPVSGGSSQFTELRVGHLDAAGNFVNPTVPINGGAATIASLPVRRCHASSRPYRVGNSRSQPPASGRRCRKVRGHPGATCRYASRRGEARSSARRRCVAPRSVRAVVLRLPRGGLRGVPVRSCDVLHVEGRARQKMSGGTNCATGLRRFSARVPLESDGTPRRMSGAWRCAGRAKSAHSGASSRCETAAARRGES